jgi:peptidyl-prolyl cis-trans isomerase C
MNMVVIKRFHGLLLALCAAMLFCVSALAQTNDAAIVLVSNSLAKVTKADYEAELLKLPADIRPGFANNQRRVNDLLSRMLLQKSLAAQARAAKLDTQPETALRLNQEIDRLLSQYMVESIEATAAAQFDARKTEFEPRARELYLADRAKYTTPEQLVVTHILFDTKKHDPAAAKKLAEETRAKIVAGADMGQLARELSDDPSAQRNYGKIDWFSKGQMDPAFAEAAFALINVGQISQPVLSQFGWHIIRLDSRRPAATQTFEQAHDAIMADLQKRYVDERREEALAAIRRDPKTEVNREAVEALTVRIDLDTVKRGLDTGVPASAPAAPSAK